MLPHTALPEAEQLIQSLLQVDNDPEKYLDLPSSKFDKQRHTLHWSGIETSHLSSHSVPHLPLFDGHTPYSSSQYSIPTPTTPMLSYIPLIPPTSHTVYSTDDWRHDLSSKSDTRLNYSRKKTIKSKPHPFSSKSLNLKSDKSSLSRHGVESDVISSQDWGEGEVRENVSSIVQALMEKPVKSVRKSEGGCGERGSGHDPRVTMDMRHKQVREHRHARDQARKQDVKKRRQQKEVWQEAERLVREGEREEGRKRRREERLLTEQMETIRQQVQAETERKRRDRSVGVSSTKPHPSVVLSMSEREAVMVNAGMCVREEVRERRRRENRTELVRQLEEMTLSDKKERSKILRHTISVWYGMVTEQRTKLRRAGAWRAWHVMGRVWNVWRRYVRERRERRDNDRLTREMQRQKRLVLMAISHYHHHLLRNCMNGWILEVGRERGRKERGEEEKRHRDRMEAFLAAAEATSNVNRQEMKKERVDVSETPASSEKNKMKDKSSEKKIRHQPIMWQEARKHVDELLSTVAPPTTNEGEESCETDHTSKSTQPMIVTSRVSEKSRTVVRERRKEIDGKPITFAPPSVWPARPQPKPVTKPIPMSGMQLRAEEIAERRRRREERESERVRERDEKERREEEEKRQREQQEREALAAQRREERKIAKQREMEKLKRQKKEREQLSLSVAHYTTHLMLGRGLRPWLRFIEDMRCNIRRADTFNLNWRMQCAFGKWREIVARRLDQRQQTADELHHRMLTRRVWQGWRKYVHDCQCMEAACEGWARELLCRAVFRAWVRDTATARREGWERERRAKMHYVRQLKRRVLLSWQHYVPLSKEEREREVRRAGLRRKVTQWLPDYQPRDFDHENITL